MTTPQNQGGNNGNSPRKAPPPVPKPPTTPSRQPVSIGTHQSQHTNSTKGGLLEAIRGFLPSFKYQVTANLRQPASSLSEIKAALQSRLPGCEVIPEGNNVILVKNIDRFLDLGFLDKWLFMNWLFREVDARFTLRDSSVLVADIEQRPSARYGIFFLICIPLCCLGWVTFAQSILGTFLAKGFLQSAIQRLLNDIAR